MLAPVPVSVRRVELGEAVRRRRMVRSFRPEPVPGEVLDRILQNALRAPSAGFTQGVDLLVLEGRAQTGLFFEATCDEAFLAEPKAMAGLLEAPVVVVPVTDPGLYVARYAEGDKAASSLSGLPAGEWPVPYWHVDASFAVMMLLLAAVDEGLGALFFRLHRDPAALLASLGAPGGKLVIGAVALGYEASGKRPGPGSPAGRVRRQLEEVVHRGRW